MKRPLTAARAQLAGPSATRRNRSKPEWRVGFNRRVWRVHIFVASSLIVWVERLGGQAADAPAVAAGTGSDRRRPSEASHGGVEEQRP